MRLLVIGGSGLLGFKIAELAVREFETFATYNFRPIKNEGCSPLQLDKCNRDELHMGLATQKCLSLTLRLKIQRQLRGKTP